MKKLLYSQLLMVCSGFFISVGMLAQPTHLSIPVNHSYDDAEESAKLTEYFPEGGVTRTSSDLELYWDDAPQFIGTLFRDVQIPTGATIDSAYIQFVAKKASDATVDIQIYGVDSAQVDSIKEFNYAISGKAPTEATVDWSPDPWLAEYDAGPAQQTPDLKDIVTEIISNDGWASGNNMMFVLTGTVDEDANRNAYSFDMDEEGPVLHVWFTAGTGIKDEAAQIQTLVYPNPAGRILYIEHPTSSISAYAIYSVSGRLVKDKLNMNSQKLVVNLSDLAEGMYFVKVICGETSGTHKVLVR